MNEEKIASKIAAGSWSDEIGKLFRHILDANEALGKARDDASSLFISLSSYREDINDGTYPMMTPVERKQMDTMLHETLKKLYLGNQMVRSSMIESVKAGKAYMEAEQKAKDIK
jgi:hypothetical protein